MGFYTLLDTTCNAHIILAEETLSLFIMKDLISLCWRTADADTLYDNSKTSEEISSGLFLTTELLLVKK